MLRQRRIVVLTSLAIGLAGSGTAQQSATPFDFFNERCLKSGPNFEGTEVFASLQGWSSLPEEVLMALTPIAEPTALRGWIASGQSEKMEVVVVSKGMTGQQSIEGRTVGLYAVDTQAFERTVTSRAGLGRPGKQELLHRIDEVFFKPQVVVAKNS